jgi:hypothetical protein
VAITNKARRMYLWRKRFLTSTKFSEQFDCLHGLLGSRLLSLPNCRWCAGAIMKMRTSWPALEVGELLDSLDKKCEASFKRAQDRATGRLVARQNKRGPKPMLTLPPLPPDLDPWADIDVAQFTNDDVTEAL